MHFYFENVYSFSLYTFQYIQFQQLICQNELILFIVINKAKLTNQINIQFDFK